jgi:hypothetical protein
MCKKLFRKGKDKEVFNLKSEALIKKVVSLEFLKYP